ncbi:phosphatase PAP2 family protein [Pseudonocardia nematodicida]|uniref:Phosphatase PAP2 family protein n=1 Tax=Pseudonocardia nematodicida TaxID=1206997 RepID=A0ABV1KC96_9PSEU
MRGDSPPSLLGPLRRPAPVLVAVALTVFGVLAARYAGNAAAGRVDDRADAVVEALPHLPGALLARAITFGTPESVVLWAVTLAGTALLLRRPRAALLAVVAPGLTGVATTVLKPVIGRTIGAFEPGYAYPSGHTGGAVAIGLVAAVLLIGLLRMTRPGPAVAVLAALTLAAGGAVGAGMVRVGAHYATDTVGGFCTAVAIGLGSALLIDRVADRRATRAVPPASS